MATIEPTMMNIWFLKTRAPLISPPCSTLYVAHCRLVHTIGMASSVAPRANLGRRLTPASATSFWTQL